MLVWSHQLWITPCHHNSSSSSTCRYNCMSLNPSTMAISLSIYNIVLLFGGPCLHIILSRVSSKSPHMQKYFTFGIKWLTPSIHCVKAIVISKKKTIKLIARWFSKFCYSYSNCLTNYIYVWYPVCAWSMEPFHEQIILKQNFSTKTKFSLSLRDK